MEDLPPRDSALSALDEVKQCTVALLGAAREGSQSRHPLSSDRLDGIQASLLGALGKYSAACSDVKEHGEVCRRIQRLEAAIGDREERIRTAVRRLHDANRKLSTALYVAKRQLEREGGRGPEIQAESALELARRISYTTRAPTANGDGIVYTGMAPFPDDLMLKQSLLSEFHAARQGPEQHAHPQARAEASGGGKLA